MAKRALALDIGASRIALAEYEIGPRGATLVNFGMAALAAPMDSGDAATILSPAILGIVRERGIRPGPVSVSLSGQMVFTRIAAIPFAGGVEKFEQMVRYELEQNSPCPIEEMICDRQVLGDLPSGDKSVMIVGAKTEQVEAVTDALKAAGFRPEIVDVAPIATTNALKACRPEEDGCVVILDIGARTTSLVISEGERFYNRSIPTAGNTITKEIASSLGCDQATAEREKIARGYVSMGGVVEDEDETTDRISKVCRAVLTRLNAEITRSINFYRSQQGGSAPVRLYLTGGTAMLPQIDQFFAESLGIEVAYLNPFETIGVGPKVNAEELEGATLQLAATAGVAFHSAGRAMFAVNLIPASVLSERADVAKIPFVAIGAFGFVGAMVAAYLTVGHQTKVAAAALEVVERESATLQSYDGKVRAAQAAEADEKGKADALAALFARRSAAVTAVNAVKDALGSDMWIEKWEPLAAAGVDPAGARVTVRGWSDRMEALVRRVNESGTKLSTAPEIVADRLKRTAAVEPSSVVLSDIVKVDRNAQVDQFTVTVRFGKKGVEEPKKGARR